MIMTMNETFFELIQVALGVRPCLSHTPSADEWGELYKIAKKQSLVGICFAGVQKLVNQQQEPPEMLYLTWMGMAAKIQQRNEVVNRQCVELQKRLESDGYRNYIMKGQSNAALYTSTSSAQVGDLQMLRQSGDIDVYLEGGLDKVLAYAKTFGNVVHVNELEMSVPVFADTEVEFHYRPFIMRNPWKNKKLQAFFKSQEEACFANRISLGEGLTICAPTTEFNLVHQLAHIHLHLFTEGIGMRQLMDYYFVLRTSYGNDNDNENVLRIVRDLGLSRFASALMWVIAHVFANDNDNENFYPWVPNEKDGRLLLDEVMTGGNFGRHNEEQNDRKGKMGYCIWALFFRNLRLSRFDRGDWFWGPIWRISHKLTRMKI